MARGLNLFELEKTVTVNGVCLNYAEVPSPGPALVLLHGGSARWQSFKRILPPLGEKWHAYAPDFRGHGGSERVPGKYRLQEYADDVVAFLREVVQEPALLFGHSLGGMVALVVAAQYSEGVRAVAVGDAALSREHLRIVFSQDRARMALWRDWSGGQKSITELIALLQESPVPSPDGKGFLPQVQVLGKDWSGWTTFATELYQNDPDTMTAMLDRFDETFAAYEMERVLPALRCPVLLLQADPAMGGLMTDAEVEQALPLLAQGRHVQVKQTSHGLFHEKPKEVIEILQAFFQSHS